MSNYDFIQKLLGLQGIKVTSVYVNNGILYVCATSDASFAICPRCGQVAQYVHDRRRQPCEHLDIWGMKTVILLEKKRYKCDCDPYHPFDEEFAFIRRYQRRTIPYEKYIFLLTHKNTVQNVCDIVNISEGACQRIYVHYANTILDNLEPEPLRILGIDEIATKKGHNYDTIIYNQETGSVVAVLDGRTKDVLVKYLMSFPKSVREGVEAVSMDMSRSYCFGVLECMPNAKPVIDRFHIADNLYRCVDDARKHIQNRIKKYGNKHEVFGIRWALLKDVEDLTREQALRLILACTKYPEIEKLHYLKEEFRTFFRLESKESALGFLEYFKDLVEQYDIPELKGFCKTIDNWLPYILNYYDYQISNGLVEGSNHKIKNIKRRAYGYRNSRNFELRIKLEFECA